MNKPQYNTREQLINLQILLDDFDLNNLTELEVHQIIFIANTNGLYDAADLIHNRVFSRGGEEWLCPALLEW